MSEPLRSGGFDGLDDQSWSVLDGLARSLHVTDARLQPTLDAIVAAAVDTLPPVSYAGLILLVKGVLTPQSTLGEPPHQLDLLQRETGEGPCIETADTQATVFVADMGAEQRWSTFKVRAIELGVASMLCVPLRADAQTIGALSLYYEDATGFDESHRQLTELYATHAALAIGDARRTEQLHAALLNRDLIGQAKGILVERLRLTPDQAFQTLSTASQATNLKLTAVAQHLVETGELLGSVPTRRGPR